MEFYNTMNCRQEKYNLLRGQLDSLGYNQALSLESLPLVHVLFSDLTLFKDRFTRYKEIAQKALQNNQELETCVRPLQEENEHLRKENNYLHYEILQMREQFEKNLKGLRCHISELESTYSDLEFANMEQITKIGALEEQILTQNEKLFKYDGVSRNATSKGSSHSSSNKVSHEKPKKKAENVIAPLPTISSVNNYISDILSQKSPQELAKEVEKLKAERKKLSDSIDFYQTQIFSRDEEIKRLNQRTALRSVPKSSSAPTCRCHTMEPIDNFLPESEIDMKTRFDDLSKKLQSSVQTTVKLAEQIKSLERRLEQQRSLPEFPFKGDDLICICREIERLQDLHNKCHCHNGLQNFQYKDRNVKNHDDLLRLLRLVTNENDELKREIEECKNKVSQNASSTYKELLTENNNLKRDCSHLSEQLKFTEEENNLLRESNSSFQKTIEDLKAFKKSTATKSVSASFPESISSKLSETSTKKKSGSSSSNKVMSTRSVNSDKVVQSRTNDISKEFTVLKNDIIKEVESVCKQFIPSKSDLSIESEELNMMAMELEKIKAERDYYCKEYHCLQDKVFSSQRQRETSTVYYRENADEKQETSKSKLIENDQKEIVPNTYQLFIDRLAKENELFKEKINFLEDKIKSHNSEPEDGTYVLKPVAKLKAYNRRTISRGFNLREKENEKERIVHNYENQSLQNEISSLRQQIIELQHDLHYEKCESKMGRLKLEDTIKFLEIEKSKCLSKTEEFISKIRSLESTIDSLNKKIQNLLAENSCLQSQYGNLRSVNEHLERSLKNADASYQKCERELSEALRRIQFMEDEKKDLGSNASSAKKEAQVANEKLFVLAKEKDNLMEKLDAKTIEVCRLEKENGRQYCMINQLEEKISRLNCQLIRKNNEENKVENEIANLKRELELCLNAKNKLFHENRNLQSDMTSLVKDNEIIFNENENYKKEILKLKEQLQKYVEEVRRVEQILEAKELEREEMLEQFKTLSAEAMELGNNNQTLEREKKRTSDSLRAVQEKLHHLNATVENKDTLVTDLEEQVMELSNELYSLRNELLSVNDENSRLKNEVDSSKVVITSMEQKKRNCESDIHTLEQQIQQVSMDINESQSLRSKLNSQIEAQKDVISTLENAVTSSRKEAIEQSLENHSIQQKVDDLQATVKKLQQQLGGMNEALLKCQESCDDYKSQNLQLQREIINEKFEKVKAEETQSEMGDLTQEMVSPRRYLECGGHKSSGLAVLTSGGDAQGMNAAVRAVVRTGLYLGCNVFYVMEGYEGLVNDDIVVATWSSASGVLQKGGTIIGSARCLAFRTREGRLTAAKNLVMRGINNLVVIGGDGSLTGANIFREEWKSLLQELLDSKEVNSVDGVEHLHIIGIVGSIDNDFCGTDMTIGTDSALHRILEAIDAIVCTAYSHQRTFIMEVMGRRCGYLALCSGILSSATAVFIPEEPAKDWEDDLCQRIMKERDSGQRLNIIIVAEGAIDEEGKPLTCERIKDVVVQRTNHDTRITVLGHIQRGGSPSAFDRILGARMGVEAVLALLDSTSDTEPQVITLNGNQSIRLPLMQCVKKTQNVAKALDEKNYALAVKLRGRSFQRRLEVYKLIHTAGKEKRLTEFAINPLYNIAILHIGSPACGMNAAVHSFVRAGIDKKCRIFAISDGIDGLIAGHIHEVKWAEVTGWVGEGGALLGTKRTSPQGHFQEVADQLREYNIDGLLIIGGFEAFLCAIELMYEREKYEEFCIPILVAAATINNNVPGCDLSLGSDTALNEIVEICDRVRQSAQGTKRRVFICETMGGYCGYLATLAGLAGGADAAYIYEETFSIKDLHRDLFNMAAKMTAGVQRGLILRNEKCNENYNCEFMTKLYAEEGTGIFSARSNIIGHMQQGRTSSPFDRNMGLTYGLKSIDWFLEQLHSCSDDHKTYTKSDASVAVLGLIGATYAITPIAQLIEGTDFQRRLPKNQWWMKLRPVLRILGRHETTYKDGTYMYFDEPSISARFTTID